MSLSVCLVEYFTKYTVPFMDMPQFVNNFIRENDVVTYYAHKFEEPGSFTKMMELSERYGNRGVFQSYLIDALNKYRTKVRNNQLHYPHIVYRLPVHPTFHLHTHLQT